MRDRFVWRCLVENFPSDIGVVAKFDVRSRARARVEREFLIHAGFWFYRRILALILDSGFNAGL